MTIEHGHFPPDFKERYDRVIHKIDDIHVTANADAFAVLRKAFPALVADAQRCLDHLAAAYPHGIYHPDGDLEYLLESVMVLNGPITPNIEFYINLYDKYFIPLINASIDRPDSDHATEIMARAIFHTAYDGVSRTRHFGTENTTVIPQ